MSKPTKKPARTIPLPITAEDEEIIRFLLHRDGKASLNSLLESASSRLKAAHDLLASFRDIDLNTITDDEMIPTLCISTNLLINDTLIALKELNAMALQLAEAPHTKH